MDNITIGKKIIAVRRKLGLTQKEFGNRIGVTKQALSSWEHGRTLPDIITLTQIASLFGLSLNDFINNPIIEPGEGITEREYEVVRKFRSSNADTRQGIELILGIRTNK